MPDRGERESAVREDGDGGGYRFTDSMRAGVTLNLLFWGLVVYFIPKFWPF